jgi:hypothetical protein
MLDGNLKFESDSEPWFKLVVLGRTKGNQLSGAKFLRRDHTRFGFGTRQMDEAAC